MALGRFDSADSDASCVELELLAPESMPIRCVMRLRRRESVSNGWRTLLLCSLFEASQVQHALRWAAAVRDTLPEPETADLYLIMLIEDLDDNQRLRIEADEKFCRRFVADTRAECVG